MKHKRKTKLINCLLGENTENVTAIVTVPECHFDSSFKYKKMKISDHLYFYVDKNYILMVEAFRYELDDLHNFSKIKKQILAKNKWISPLDVKRLMK